MQNKNNQEIILDKMEELKRKRKIVNFIDN